MSRWQLHLCVIATFFCFSVANTGWDYREHGPDEWSLDYPECGASRQSPIQLSRWSSKWNWPWFQRRDDYDFDFRDYRNVGAGVFSNNGHSVNMAYNYTVPSASPRVLLTKNGVTSTFYLTGFHFHWPSEHRVNNQDYPLEMHMVHSDTVNGGTLVLGYVFNYCHRSRPGMKDVAIIAQNLRQVGESQSVQGFAPHRVMPYAELKCGYFAYVGSLTTPPCTEGVNWFVHETPLCVEDWQMNVFKSVLDATGDPMEGNNRPLQARNERQVAYLSCGA